MFRIYVLAGAAIALFMTISVVETLRSGEALTLFGFLTDLMETSLLAGAVFFTARVSIETRAMQSERRDLLADLSRSKAESAHWRHAARHHVEGLSKAIARQFDDWKFTDAEADVTTLMLKGLSHKEIAVLRDCSEATVRQHATRAYAKSGLAGRAQLTAYFLEDLLAPGSGRVAQLDLVRDAKST